MTKGRVLQTLDRGLQVLELLARHELGPTDISVELGIERTAVHRILRTLMHRGFVEQASNGRYCANLQHLIGLAQRLGDQRERDWIKFAASCLENLRAQTGLSANFCVPSGDSMVYLMQVLATTVLAVNSPPGTRRSIYCSAVGKAYLGSLPERELDKRLASLDLRPPTLRTVTSREDLKEQLRKARAKGYFVDDGEVDAQVMCVAAPIFDRFGNPYASIGVSGPRMVEAFKRIDEVGAQVVVEANKISAVLGHEVGQADDRAARRSSTVRLPSSDQESPQSQILQSRGTAGPTVE